LIARGLNHEMSNANKNQIEAKGAPTRPHSRNVDCRQWAGGKNRDVGALLLREQRQQHQRDQKDVRRETPSLWFGPMVVRIEAARASSRRHRSSPDVVTMRKSVIPHRRIIGTNETQSSSASFLRLEISPGMRSAAQAGGAGK
jgi:hypothetical protein